MMKTSMLLMLALTVLIAIGLRWREQRLPAVAAARKTARPGLLDRGKAGMNRWVNAAAIATVATLLIMGGLHWLKVWQQ